jgi:DNA-binding response OmpR family regulator
MDKVLVIDDEKDFLELIGSALRSRGGYEVHTALDGEEGLAKARSEKPDLVICDIRMPKMSGYDVLKGIREEVDKNMPVIILSAIEDFKNVQKAYEGEADFYISKPVEIALLIKNVRTLISLSKSKRK